MLRYLKSSALLAATLAVGFTAATIPNAHAALIGSTVIVATTSDTTPDGNGDFGTMYSTPSLNDKGEAAFYSDDLTSSAATDAGVYRGNGTVITKIARKGESVGGGTINAFENVGVNDALNNAGETAFTAQLTGPGPFAIFRGDGGALSEIVRTGDTTPNSVGTFGFLGTPVLNDMGQAAFTSQLNGAGATNLGIFRGDGTTRVTMVRRGDATPNTVGTFDTFGSPAINNVGEVAFQSTIAGAPGTSKGIFRSDATTITRIVRDGDAAPDANGTFATSYFDPSINDSGEVAFTAFLAGTSLGTLDNGGVFRGDGTTLTQIARENQSAPDANGVFATFGSPAINNPGQAAFFGTLRGTSGGGLDDSGIFVGDGSSIDQVAREGDFVCGDPTVLLNGFGDPAINNSGDVAFWSSLRGSGVTSSTNAGIFYYNASSDNLLQVARLGDSLLGSTITALGFAGGIGSRGDERSGLNERSQVAFRFELLNGDAGVAIWTIPEPSSLAIGAMACLFGAVCALRKRWG